MDVTELYKNLAHFTGTDAYHRFSFVFPNVVLTDGAEYLARSAGAYWLMDAIACYLPRIPASEGFAVANFKVENRSGVLLIDNGHDGTDEMRVIYAHQDVTFTDFPLPSITLYVGRQDDLWVILLPSEY